MTTRTLDRPVPPVSHRIAALLRLMLAALCAWPVTLAGAALAITAASGADVPALLALRPSNLAFAALAPPPPTLTPPAPVAPETAPWLVRLARPVGSGGTGTVIVWQGRRLLITAAHVVNVWPFLPWTSLAANPQPLSHLGANAEQTPLPWGRIDRAWDLAIYPVTDSGAPALVLRSDPPAAGEPLRFMGYPLGEEQPWTSAGLTMATAAHPDGGASAVVAAVDARAGQSGGALLDGAGRLVGIGVARTPWGVLAVGGGAVAATLARLDGLPSTQPPPQAGRLALWVTVAAAASALTVLLNRGLASLARRLAGLRGNVSRWGAFRPRWRLL